MKIKPITILLFFLLCIPIQMLAQKNDVAATIEQLEKEMYRLYPTRNVDEFMHVTEHIPCLRMVGRLEKIAAIKD